MLPKKVPATVRQEVANTLAKAYMAHLAGDERMPEDYTAELKRVCKFYWLFCNLVEEDSLENAYY